MDESINFTVGLSESVAWHWPIAVYLFFAGISGGALTIALFLRNYRGQTEDTPLLKGATLISFITICLGMLCLVLDLTNPLFFWKILIYYNFHSVMAIGVLALCFYIPTVAILTLIVLREEISKISFLSWLTPIANVLAKYRGIFEKIGLVLAIAVCAYTGFLIAALIRFPIINTAVLPALFVASGLSAGAACAKMMAVGLFGEDHHSSDMNILHKAEWPIMTAEILFIAMIMVSLFGGNEAQKAALSAFYHGDWANVFWVGVVGIGFIIPIFINFFTGKRFSHSLPALYIAGLSGVTGMMCLRMFILYAGQLNAI